MSEISSICVFCGASTGAAPSYAEAARAMGRAMARHGLRLVYGGGNVGTMGELAGAMMDSGGRVVGIIPEKLHGMVSHLDLTELIVVEDMHSRKEAMYERADAFIAMPGGIGTFEELFEVWTWRCLGYHGKPLGILNTSGFYDGLIAFLAKVSSEGFLKAGILEGLLVADDPETMLDLLSGEGARS